MPILVRHVFQAKYGRGDEIVAALKEMSGGMTERVRGYRVLTDLSGPFFTVVMEYEVESLGEFEKGMAEAFSDPRMQEFMGRTAPLIESGRREFYTVQHRA
jgi:hypothetical protein